MRYPEIAKRFQLILDLRKMKARDLADKSGLTEAAISH
jgi:DNA-binding Xre family transcriptional regulator